MPCRPFHRDYAAAGLAVCILCGALLSRDGDRHNDPPVFSVPPAYDSEIVRGPTGPAGPINLRELVGATGATGATGY